MTKTIHVFNILNLSLKLKIKNIIEFINNKNIHPWYRGRIT